MPTLEDKQTQVQIFLESCSYTNLSEICKILLQKQMTERAIEQQESIVVEKIHSYIFSTKDEKILDLCLQVLEA